MKPFLSTLAVPAFVFRAHAAGMGDD